MYPPPPPAYTAEQVEAVRQDRLRAVKRRYNISLGLQVAFTAVFAALLGYYIWRDRNYNRRYDSDEGRYYYTDGWFRWYIGLLIALLCIDLLCIFVTFRQRKRAINWLQDPNTPPHLIMLGVNPQSDYAEHVVVVQQPPHQGPNQNYYYAGQNQGYYQPPPPPPPMYSQANQNPNMYMPPSSPPPATASYGQGNEYNRGASPNYQDPADRTRLEKPLV